MREGVLGMGDGTIEPPRLARRALLLGGAFAGLAGCTGIIPGTGTPPQIFVLSRKTTFPPDLPSVASQLLVDTPVAPAEIDTNRIALSRSPTRVDYFADSVWADRAPAMVQSLVIESFEQTGKIPAISRDLAVLRADYILMSELRRFEAIYASATGAPTVVVRLLVRLVKMPERTIIAQSLAERREEAAQNGLDAIVEAFNEALGGVMKELVTWTLRRIKSDARA
jgi:cholesterol transport system auxiliary component